MMHVFRKIATVQPSVFVHEPDPHAGARTDCEHSEQ